MKWTANALMWESDRRTPSLRICRYGWNGRPGVVSWSCERPTRACQTTTIACDVLQRVKAMERSSAALTVPVRVWVEPLRIWLASSCRVRLLRAGTQHAQSADSLLIGALVHAISSAQPGPGRDRHGLVERAQRYILDNIRGYLTVAAIVAAAGVSSPRALFRAFHEMSGASPMAWARYHRLQGVRAELQDRRSNHQSISQIASNWGFTHFGHFCEAYRRLHGETPTATRRRGADSVLP